jgi:hypothetical protein
LPKARAAAIYDGANNQMIVYAGVNRFWARCSNEITPFGDLWILAHANGQGWIPAWSEMTPLGTPPTPRWQRTAVYDDTNNRMLAFGGVMGTYRTPVLLDDLWQPQNANGIGGGWLQGVSKKHSRWPQETKS